LCWRVAGGVLGLLLAKLIATALLPALRAE